MNKLERIEEMENQLAALKEDVKAEEKPKRVRVYIKEDAEAIMAGNWNNEMLPMIGSVFDVDSSGGEKIYVKSGVDSCAWTFKRDCCVIVEGSLEDLK